MKRGVSIFVALALSVVGGVGLTALNSGGNAQAPAIVGDVQVSGLLTILWGDPRPGSGLPSRTVYMLTDDRMQARELLIAEAIVEQAGGLLALNRKWVTVNGVVEAPQGLEASQRATQVIRVTSIALAERPSPLAALEPQQPAVTGSQPWITLMCKFQDIGTEPNTLAFFQGMYSSSSPGLDHYWRQLSFNIANVAGSNAVGWYTLPHPRSYYVYDADLDGFDELDFVRTRDDCTAAADKDVFFPTFIGINMMFNSNLDCCAWGGSSGTITLDGTAKSWSMTWEPPWAYADISVIAHEMGHGFGLPHSSGQYGATYDNAWDVMSWDRVNCASATDPTYGCLAQHTISYHKDLLGWIGSGRYDVPFGTSARFTIEHLAAPAVKAYQMAKVPVRGSATHFYTVEVRKRVGYDSKLIGDAVIIHDVVTNRANGRPANVIDYDGNGNTNDAGAMWTVGEMGVDVAAGIKVLVNSATATGFNVSITNRAVQSDFNDDGRTDLVWRNAATGTATVWYMSGATRTGWALLETVADRNWQIAAVGDLNGDGDADLVWRNTVTGANTVWYMNGAEAAMPTGQDASPLAARIGWAALDAVTDTNWQIAAAADFNNDGRADLVWRNYATGTNTVWYMNGATVTGWAALDAVTDTNWQIAAAEDFNFDGRPDLVWRNAATGTNTVWYMNGATVTGWALLDAVTDTSWQIATVGDLNGDGLPDLVWRNYASGATTVWYMNGVTQTGWAMLETVADTSWAIMRRMDRAGSTTDFNLDGKADLVWRNYLNGANTVWYMDGATRVGWAPLDAVADTNWQITGVGDFNVDGKSDLVWRNDATGANTLWYMNGTTMAAWSPLETVPDTDFQIAAVGDFNGDGKPDLVWRNVVTGTNTLWYMDGATRVGWAVLEAVTDTTWRIVAVGDFNGDSKSDLVWRNAVTGTNTVWYMDGATRIGWATLETVADANWEIAAVADFNRDGYPDIVWRNYSTGLNTIWYMNGTTRTGWATLETVADTHWAILRRR